MEENAIAAFEVRGLSLSYETEDGRVTPLHDVSLTVPVGQFVCIIGPSGGGKTTLLRCLAGLLSPTEGEILSNGHRVDGPAAERGMVFQQDAIPMWRRVRENIGYGLELRGVEKRERERIVDHYLEAVDLRKFERAWPKQLSGGMRKRVAVAATFANDPASLLMDEPFGSLDYFTRSNLHDLLLKLWSETGKTIVFVTHDVDEAIKLADRILVVRDGGILDDLEVPFERPRTEDLRADAAANAMRGQLLEMLGEPVAARAA
jgi:NitT/TauT family transport system ATP-binding protein